MAILAKNSTLPLPKLLPVLPSRLICSLKLASRNYFFGKVGSGSPLANFSGTKSCPTLPSMTTLPAFSTTSLTA